MCSSGTSSTVQGKSLQLRAQYTLGRSTCSRSCGPFAAVTSTRNSRQVALRTNLGLLMRSRSTARPHDRTDHLVMTESTNNDKIWIKLTTQTCDASACASKMKVSTFVWAKCPRPNASTTIARGHFPEMSCPREILSLQTKTFWPK